MAAGLPVIASDLPVLRQMHAHKHPKQALRELRQQRAASALDYQSIRNLAGSVAQSYPDSRARMGFPMAPRAWADEVLAQLAKRAA